MVRASRRSLHRESRPIDLREEDGEDTHGLGREDYDDQTKELVQGNSRSNIFLVSKLKFLVLKF